MKKFIISLLLLVSAFSARGNTVTTAAITPTKYSDLKDLDHSTAVSWGFDLSAAGLNLGKGWSITSATISIDNINDWQVEKGDILFIDLLDNPVLGTNGQKYFNDTNDAASDFFLEKTYGKAIKVKNPEVTRLTTFSDTNEYVNRSKKVVNPSEDFTYNLTGSQLAVLSSYLQSAYNSSSQWNVGLGFDADCHYYNDGITFTVTTTYVPDAASTLGLFGLGALALVGLRRFSRRA